MPKPKPFMSSRFFAPALAALALLLGIGLGLGITGAASALTIDCASADCLGGRYTLDVSQTGRDRYVATLTVDTRGAFDVRATRLLDVSFKVANSYSNVTVLSGPDTRFGSGPLTGQGCSSRGASAGFFCGDLASNLRVGRVYTWRIQFRTASLLDEWHVGARYGGDALRSGWVVSESGSPTTRPTSPTSPIPEPSAALVFGAGLLVANGWMNRARAAD